MLNNLKISRKLALSYASIVIISIATSIVCFSNNITAQTATRWNSHTYRVLGKIADARYGMVDQETGVRGFLIAGNSDFLAPYEAGKAQTAEAVDAIAELTSDNAVQQQRVAKLRGLIAKWQTEIADREIGMTKADAGTDARQIEIAGAGKALMDETRGLLDQMSAEESSLLGTRSETARSAVDFANLMIVVGGLACLCAAAAMAFLMSRSIAKPVIGMTAAMRELASGNLSVIVPSSDRTDEVGDMAKAVQIFKDAAFEQKRLEGEAASAREAQALSRDRQAAIDNAKAEDLRLFAHAVEAGFDKLSAGDLTVRMTQAVAPEFEPIRAKFNASVGQLEETIGSVVGAVGTMRVGLNQITVAAGDLSQRTEQQAASLEETVAALSEVMRGVSGTAESADDARAAASVALAEAEKGGRVVSQAIAAMAEIEQSSNRIGNIISVIDEIAFQTNLLALNAGVEAARAGEAGRGFAVVAQEVRGLAQRSAEAAKEIKDLISTSANQVEEGVELVSASGRSLEQIVAQVGGVAASISQMAQGAREQAVSLKEVATAADQMDKVTQQNAAMVEETTAAAQSLSGETAELAQLTERFRTTAGASRVMAPAAARPAPRRAPAPVPQMRQTAQAQPVRDDWEEF